jgi:hypothetical protein
VPRSNAALRAENARESIPALGAEGVRERILAALARPRQTRFTQREKRRKPFSR